MGYRMWGKTAVERVAARYIPKGAIKVAAKSGAGVAYLYERHGRVCAIGFVGTSVNPSIDYSYKSPERRAEAVAGWLKGLDEAKASKAARMAAKREKLAAPHGLKVGDVLRSSWGYDQTNIDYYEVVELKGARGVLIREIGCESVETGFMSGNSVPTPGKYIGEPMLKRVGEHDEVKVRDFGVWARKMEPVKIAGKAVAYSPSSWTAYA